MRHRTIRAILAIWIVIPAVAGLYRPAAASVPLTVDFSDGYTFSGLQRTTKTGAIEESIVNPIGPFTISGDRGFVQISWNKGQADSYLNCDPTQFVRSVSETIQNRQTNHYSVDLSGTSGQVESIYLGIPSFENAGIGTTTEFPVEQVTVDILYVDDQGQQGTGSMTPVSPQVGDAVGYHLTFNPFLENHNFLHIDVTFTGEVDPPLSGTPQTASLNCPAPNENLEESTDFGVTQLFLNDPYVVVNVAEDAPNHPPVLNSINDVTIDEGAAATISISGSDDDGDDVFITGNLPDFAILTDNGDGTGSIAVSPDFDDGGVHLASVDISDDGDPSLSDAQTFTISVNNVNRNPNIAPIDDVTVDEGQTAMLEINGSDGDDNFVVITANLPDFANLTDNGDGTGNIAISPGLDDAGAYTASATLTDDGNPILDDTETFTITVNDVNRNPNLTLSPGELILTEGEAGTITISSDDPDGDGVTITGENVPGFGTLTDNGDGTASLAFNPEPGDAGNYTISITASDDGDPILSDTGTLILTIEPVEGPGVESYDELESLIIASVDNRFVERLMVGTLNLAQYFDEELALDWIAVALLRGFIEFVDAATPRWIDPLDAEVLIGFAILLIDNIIGP